MTLQFLQTARYNATPLARHIDTPEQAQPVYTDPEALLADMMATARAENRRAGLSPKPDYTRKSSAGQDPNSLHAQIFRAVRDHGPILMGDIVEIVKIRPRHAYNLINKAKEMAHREGYRWCVKDVYEGKRQMRSYWLEDAE